MHVPKHQLNRTAHVGALGETKVHQKSILETITLDCTAYALMFKHAHVECLLHSYPLLVAAAGVLCQGLVQAQAGGLT